MKYPGKVKNEEKIKYWTVNSKLFPQSSFPDDTSIKLSDVLPIPLTGKPGIQRTILPY